ncbi:transcription elongation factor elongin B [Brevipalpus obovatus]|uniref:transcription elongation factor elongin B n=1 Tax=Brevipalpus obovatus TaxID=246614 RepID=UPI003D9E8FB3
MTNVFLMVRRKKTTIFLDAKESTSVLEVKKMIAGILKVSPEDQRLFYKSDDRDEILSDHHCLSDYGINSDTAKAQHQATLGLAIRNHGDGDFEKLEISPLSTPPELPDVMKPDGNPTVNSEH